MFRAPKLPLGVFGIPHLDVVEVAVLAGHSQLDLGLCRVGDPGRLDVAGRLARERDPHFVVHLDHRGVPLCWHRALPTTLRCGRREA